MAGDFMAIIDGTGQSDDGDYAIDMAGSFCAQLKLKLAGRASYERGPTAAGGEVAFIAYRVEQTILDQRRRGANRIFLAGYSRGGSVALRVADALRLQGIAVDGLILFDPVRKHSYRVPGGIPENVAKSISFYRELTPAFEKLCASATKDIDLTPSTPVQLPGFFVPDALKKTREWQMLNVGATIAATAAGSMANDAIAGAMHAAGADWFNNPARPGWTEDFNQLGTNGTHLRIPVLGTHGALGGVGWGLPKIIEIDKSAQSKVAAAANEALAAWGFNFKLHSIGPIPQRA